LSMGILHGMYKRKYPTDISQTSGAFARAIARKRPRTQYRQRSIKAGGGPVVNVTRGRGFPTLSSTPMPQSMICTHKYSDIVNINPAIGSVGVHTFAANGLYDPNITGGGHQPVGFDQFTAFYNHYEVLGAKIQFTIHPSQESGGFNFGIKLDDNDGLTGVLNTVMEGNMTVFKSVPGPYTSDKGFTCISSYSAKKFFGDKCGQRDTWGTVAANPVDLAYFMCWISPLTGLQDLGSIPCTVLVEYIVKWHEPKDLPSS